MQNTLKKYVLDTNENRWINNYRFFNMYDIKDYNSIVKNMMEDKYLVPTIGFTNDFYSTSYNRSTLRLIHGFRFIEPLINEFIITRDNKYLLKLISILSDWIKRFRYENCKDFMAFHDETTALRLRQLINLFNICKNNVDAESLNIVYREIKYTVELLILDEFYSYNTNHGFFQDTSILVYCKYFIYDNTDKYNQIASSRISEYLQYIFTSEGVHKEHSPEYHFIIISKLKSLINDDIISDKKLKKLINDIYFKSVEYSSYIPMPDLSLPKIGDTKGNLYINKHFNKLYDDKYYKSIVDESYKNINFDNFRVFKEAGYAILRNKWSKDSVYILFLASYHTTYHKHSDDLSLLIYYKGEIISEAGPYGYLYSDQMCKYGYSDSAHNSLIVNNKSLNRFDKQYDKVGISNYSINKDVIEVLGFNNRHEGVRHNRCLKFDSKSLEINIVDEISSNSVNDYRLLFHLGEDIIPILKEGFIDLYRKDLLVAVVEIESNKDVNYGVSYGEDDKMVKGIHFNEMYYHNYNWVIYINPSKVSSIDIKTSIRLISYD